MYHRFPIACLLLLALPVIASAASVPDPARVAEIAKMLPERPRGVGPKITDRKAWGQAAKLPEFRDVVKDAERLLKKPIPELTDELFLDFSKTGNRNRCQHVLAQRHGRMPIFVLAECIENKGRFLPAIEESIAAVCSEKTWVLPAHDRSLRNFRGQANEIDLRVAGESWNMATAYYWLGEKLSPKTRKLVRDELERRTFTPFENSLKTGKPRLWWLGTTNNWNAVCLAGVNGAAQAMIDDPKRRAYFIAAAEKYVQNFLRGFTPDGYCSEGVGYWNYGFGHYTMLAETVYQATDGKLDMFADPRVKKDAWFAPSMEILPGVYPAFADCSPGSKPSTPLMAFLSRRFGFGMKEIEKEGLGMRAGPSNSLFATGLYCWDNSATMVKPVDGKPVSESQQSWFPDAGVLIYRPAPGQKNAMGVALKGGNNAEHHNHNDVGSYLVALGDATPLIDPGAEVYTARTFSSKRYVSGVLNSLGHPVPRVAGKLQRTGRSAAGKVLEKGFTDAADIIVFDIRSAYDVKELKKLERTFVFTRRGRGSLTVTDEVEFDSPQSFGTALITMSDWKQVAPNRLRIGKGAEAVEVEISTSGSKFKIEPTEIKEDVRTSRLPVRLGIELTEPVTKATVTVKIVPARK